MMIHQYMWFAGLHRDYTIPSCKTAT